MYDDYGVKTHFVPQIEESELSQSVPMEASTRKERFDREKLHPRRYSLCYIPLQTSGDGVIIWSFGNLIACTMTMGSKHTLFPKFKNHTSPKVCPWKRQLARSVLREKKLHPRTYSFCNNPYGASGGPVIVWSVGNMIAGKMTMGSKHTSFSKLKNQTSPKVWPWKRQLASNVLREKNSIRGGTHFAMIPIKRMEIL